MKNTAQTELSSLERILDSSDLAKNIAFEFLKLMSPAGMKAGRYIYVDYWRNQLIDYAAQRLGLGVVDETLRSVVEQELKQGWQNIINKTY